MSTWAILAAAGSGERLGADRPKAFVALGELPLLATSMERLDESDWIDAIVVAAPPGWEEPSILLAEEIGAGKVSAVVPGGATRAESVRLALAEVPDEAVAVLVHDAARPLVDDEVVGRVLTPLRRAGTASSRRSPSPTPSSGSTATACVETLDRADLVAVQTPQAFLADALRRAVAGGGDATDCAALVEGAGGRIRWVEGDPRL